MESDINDNALMEDLAPAHEDKNPDWYELGIKIIRWIYSIMR